MFPIAAKSLVGGKMDDHEEKTLNKLKAITMNLNHL